MSSTTSRGRRAILHRLAGEEEGQGLTEYSLLLVFIATACIAAAVSCADSINHVHNQISGSIQNVMNYLGL